MYVCVDFHRVKEEERERDTVIIVPIITIWLLFIPPGLTNPHIQ